MRIAALYDIHANLPALTAVLDELAEVKPDVIVIGGDSVPGPMPRQTLERLQQLGAKARVIRGNTDREVLAAFDDASKNDALPDALKAIRDWSARKLTEQHRIYLAQLPEQVTLHVDGLGDVLFCHATPRSDTEIFTPITPQERLDTIFAGITQQVVVCGHTHMQFELRAGDVRIVNAGSVGMPYAEQPGAYWLLLGPDDIEFRRTGYDVQAAAQAIQASDYPQAREFATENVLVVPGAAEATEIFESMARGK